MIVTLNNSTKYSLTRLALNEVIYGFKIKESLDLLRIEGLNLEDLSEEEPTPQEPQQGPQQGPSSHSPTSTEPLPKASNSLPQQPPQVRVPAKPSTTHTFPTDTYRPEYIDT